MSALLDPTRRNKILNKLREQRGDLWKSYNVTKQELANIKRTIKATNIELKYNLVEIKIYY